MLAYNSNHLCSRLWISGHLEFDWFVLHLTGGSASGCDCLSYGLGLVWSTCIYYVFQAKETKQLFKACFSHGESPETKSNYKNMFMTSAFIINMKILLANWNEMTKPKVTGDIVASLPVEGDRSEYLLKNNINFLHYLKTVTPNLC